MPRSTRWWLVAVATLSLAACSSTATTSGGTTSAATGSAAPTSSEQATTSPGAAAAAEWSYSGDTGPANWSEFAPACAGGPQSEESPIDIETAALASGPAAAVTFHYTPAAFELENNGHTIEAIPEDLQQDSITINGTPYYLQQFHFHADSEHQINGQNTAMEMHLVHKSDAGQTAVVGVLLTPGSADAPLDELFSSVPAQENSESPIELHNQIDLSQVLPSDQAMAQYQGSLTTPPCSEGIEWNVFLTPVTLSPDQISAFTAVYADNSRPVQPLNGRTVVQTQPTQ